MTSRPKAAPAPVPSDTSARLRHDIDSGRSGDKIRFSDPAAAPLGTDDEAAGTPPTAAQVAYAREMEVRSRTDDPSAVRTDPDIGRLTRGSPGTWLFAAAILMMLAAVAVAVMVA